MILNDKGLAEAGWTIDLIATDIACRRWSTFVPWKAYYSQFGGVQRGSFLSQLISNFTREEQRWRISEAVAPDGVTFRVFQTSSIIFTGLSDI